MAIIFNQLAMRKVPYAVCISETRFKVEAVEGYGKDYFLLCSYADNDKLKDDGVYKKGLGFKQNPSMKKTLTRTMTDIEVLLFHSRIKKYRKVHHDSVGRVYELKNESFGDYYKRVNKHKQSK